jgi:hypothetical protein
MERLEKLKLILGIEGTEQDALLLYQLQVTESFILNYCNINVLPTELEEALVEMAADNYKTQDGVSDIKIGDTSISYADVSDISPKYKAQLNHFRRLRLI